jgi:hypothetical protein
MGVFRAGAGLKRASHRRRRAFDRVGPLSAIALVAGALNWQKPAHPRKHEESAMHKQRRKFRLFCGIVCACGVASGLSGARAEDAPAPHYSHATQLALREAPAADAAVLAQLPINQPVRIVSRGNRWCRVRLMQSANAASATNPANAVNSGQEGHVDCAFLRDRKLDFPEIESEAARLFLELNRPGLAPEDEARVLEWLFT